MSDFYEMCDIQISLPFDYWYEVMDSLKFREFDFKENVKLRVISKEIHRQLCSGLFREGYERKEREIEQEVDAPEDVPEF